MAILASSSRSKGSGGGSSSRSRDRYKDIGGTVSHEGHRGGRDEKRGGARSRILARASASSRERQSSGGSAISTEHGDRGVVSHSHSSNHIRRRALDPTLLARGMSSRSVGARVSGRVRPVTPPDRERDLRHMEAYASACTAYAQQFFVYRNREGVAGGLYGPVPAGMVPGGAGAVGPSGVAGAGVAPGGRVGVGTPAMNGSVISEGGTTYYDSATGNYVNMPGKHVGRGVIPVGSVSGHLTPGHPGLTPHPISMPVKIDPEEEKRLALLRKRVAASEAKREVLETEYLSLRAHYVYESQRLRKTKRAVTGQLDLLRDLLKRRGEALALRRVRCAIVRDAHRCLERRKASSRSKGAEEGKADEDKMQGIELTNADAKNSENVSNNYDAAKKERESLKSEKVEFNGSPVHISNAKDVLEVWSWMESKLADAERACTMVVTPPDLLMVKNPPPLGGTDQPIATTSSPNMPVETNVSPPSSSKSGLSGSASSRRSKLPVKGNGDGDSSENAKENGSSSKKKPREGVTSKKVGDDCKDKDGKKGKDSPDGAGRSRESSSSSSSSSASSSSSKQKIKENDDVIPWDCQILPPTPYGVPVKLSFLSLAPDKGAAYGEFR